MTVVHDVIEGIAFGGYATRVLPEGLKDINSGLVSASCNKCSGCPYNSPDDWTVQFCRRPANQICLRTTR